MWPTNNTLGWQSEKLMISWNNQLEPEIVIHKKHRHTTGIEPQTSGLEADTLTHGGNGVNGLINARQLKQ